MNSTTTCSPETRAAYTTARSDLLALVPESARRILEIGCSDGTLGAAIKQRGDPGTYITGIEANIQLANTARERLDAVFSCDAEQFDWSRFDDEPRFDCLICGDVLEHLRAPAEVLGHAIRHLKPDGAIVTSLPNIRHISALWAIALSGRFPRRERGIFDKTHLRWFTIHDARDMVGAVGFSVTKEVFNLRAWDRGGGRINRALGRLPQGIASSFPVREFLTYQYSFRAERLGAPTNVPT